jgi:catechol-2,3-dioxygenase
MTMSTDLASPAGQTGTATQPLPARPTMHHVTLKTGQLAAMIDWYERVLGLDRQFVFERGAWLTNDAANHRLGLLSTEQIGVDPDALHHAGLHHSAFEFDDLDQWLASYVRLRDQGISPHMVCDHGMTMSMYYADPDGNSVELQVDNFGNWHQSSAWMRTSPEFEADPIGPPCDPEAILVARSAGASHAEIHERAYRGEFAAGAPMDPRLPL